jgi:S-adenosylmethionine decarboxylase
VSSFAIGVVVRSKPSSSYGRKNKTQAFFPCVVGVMLYNSGPVACYAGEGDRTDAISGEERGSIGLHSLGRHLLLELYDCSSEVLNSLETVKTTLVEAARRAEATIVDVVFHAFNPFGISGVVVIAESHLSIHTWPEYRYAAVDIFSCGTTLKPAEAAAYLVEQFRASRASCVEVKRGVFPGPDQLLNRPTEAEGTASNGPVRTLQVVL